MPGPKDFLAHAEAYLPKAQTDVDYRSVVVNAYYAAYHAARRFEESLPERSQLTTSNTGSHDALIKRLECPHSKMPYALITTSKYVGGQMRMFKALRELASYELQESVGVNQAEEAIRSAKDILSECLPKK